MYRRSHRNFGIGYFDIWLDVGMTMGRADFLYAETARPIWHRLFISYFVTALMHRFVQLIARAFRRRTSVAPAMKAAGHLLGGSGASRRFRLQIRDDSMRPIQRASY